MNDEPIVDPAIPDAYRWRILATPAELRADAGPSTWERRLCTVGGFVAALLGAFLLGMAVETDARFVALWTVPLFVLAAMLIHAGRTRLGTRLKRLYGDCYVLPADLDLDARELVGRVRDAIEQVSRSQVKRLGMLDGIADDVVLPHRLWDIARLLRIQVALRAEQAAALTGVVTPELAEVLAPQREALNRSVETVVGQVREIEAYAQRVAAADAALRARDLMKSNDKYRDLLARTHDTEGLRDLADQVRDLESRLAGSLRDVVAAGRTLAVPEDAA
ncbi:hypothetical protein [Streptosporangium sp. KLBMP 9127]|nr:hypothetical protein [Streptosporangium sp. KLBMP 9127]